MNEIILNSNTCNGHLSAAESKQAVPCQGVACWSAGNADQKGFKRGLCISVYLF